jgi:replication initiation protein RepC
LVAADLILRRDSPNGKRYCHRDDSGELSTAFGFDLAPLALSAASIFEACDAVKAENRARSILRSAGSAPGRPSKASGGGRENVA